MIASIHLFKAHTPQPIPPVDDDDDDDDDERKPGTGGGNIDPDDDEGGSDDDDDDDDDEDETQSFVRKMRIIQSRRCTQATWCKVKFGRAHLRRLR